MSTTRTPEQLGEQIRDLASNLWWSWNPDAIRLFRDLAPDVFHDSNHSALAVYQTVVPGQLARVSEDPVLRARIDKVHREFRAYLSPDATTWAGTHAAPLKVRPVAYFSAEFGIHESLPIYSGGLGILAGDHIKTASDLGLSLVGVGLFYRESYFRQLIDESGQQHAEYNRAQLDRVPASPLLDRHGNPLIIEVPMDHSVLHAQVWQANIGRARLLLLDTDVERNSPEDRALAARLYFGDSRVRIRQELLLGVGGVRALRAAGIDFSIMHLNEGHSAFATLEYTRSIMEDTGASFADAAQEVAQSTVFTTHTPVAAGHDRFSPELADAHLEPLRRSLGLGRNEFLGLGRIEPRDENEMFCMTVLAFKMSRWANGVSALHGRVTRKAWQVLWPHHREDEVPVGHITNGVHLRTWVAPAMQELFRKYLGRDWMENITNPDLWARMDEVDDAELWEVHRILRASLVRFARREVGEHRSRVGLDPELTRAAESALDPHALTIGFARRFATYKRGNLIFSDIDRVLRIMGDAKRPVQFVFAGKAHPADKPGQAVLREVYQSSLRPDLLGKVVFVEDYDINVARHLVQGVDVWLNNPRRPLEASGTSGQKVLLNGGLNLSILDGWWAEAWDGENGFAIGNGRTHVSQEEQDRRDALSLYDVLENQVIPTFFDRDSDGIPRAWVRRMKRAFKTMGWRFNTDRMVKDYTTECYLPAACTDSCVMPK
ncbi:MAG: alpha-glucan family phosphorylase [Deltaproteobacteria bacterium]|nr:alpha-glucan family phosphorylase [Deltaproteobacteria bacterium]